jgi:hypothetical protein
MDDSTDTYILIGILGSAIGLFLCIGIKLVVDYMRIDNTIYEDIV